MRKIIGLVTVVACLSVLAAGCGKKEEAQGQDAAVKTEAAAQQDQGEASAPENSAESDSDFLEKHGNEIIIVAKSTLGNYWSGFKMTLAPEDWALAKYDDKDAMIAVSEVTYHGVTGPYIYVGTLEFDDAGKVVSVTSHYVQAQDVVLADDGYCVDVLEKVGQDLLR